MKKKPDEFEKQIINDIENDEFEPVKNQEKEIKRYKGYFNAIDFFVRQNTTYAIYFLDG